MQHIFMIRFYIIMLQVAPFVKTACLVFKRKLRDVMLLVGALRSLVQEEFCALMPSSELLEMAISP
jgi:hypothetical protein